MWLYTNSNGMTFGDDHRNDRLAFLSFPKVAQVGDVLVISDPTANLELAQPE